MSEIDRLVGTLKRRLKAQGITYRELGARLGLSEASVKRMFATRRFSLDRLLEIGHLLGFSLAELAQEAALSGTRLHTLSESQERELVSDEQLLLVAVCVLNQWTVEEILAIYRLGEAECVRCLARLDRLRLLDLLPGNRVRLNVARDFDWRPDGPIRRFFLRQGLGEFLASDFAGADEVLGFAHGMLTESALAKLQAEIRTLLFELIAEVDIWRHGLAGERFFRAIKEDGKIFGTYCPRCDHTYVPATTFCERCLGELTDWVEVGTHGEVHTYTLLYNNYDGSQREEPLIVAFVKIGDGGLIHQLDGIKPGEVEIGMQVRAIFKPKKDRQGSILDILHFKPVKG